MLTEKSSSNSDNGPNTDRTLESDSSIKNLTRWFSHPKAPAIVLTLSLAVLGGVLAKDKLNFFNSSSPSIVVFDPVKFLNAQRATAASLMTSPNADMSLALTQVAKQAENVIKEEAEGSLVLVKQAVVGASQYTDITDRVLLRFGLPTGVPTITTSSNLSLGDIAPTDHAFGELQAAEDYKLELLERNKEIKAAADKAGNQIDIVP